MAIPRPKTRNALASKLKKLMEVEGMTQRDLAAVSGVSQTQIGNILRGTTSCSTETADALAKPFGMSGWQLTAAHIPANFRHSGSLNKLIAAYTNASDDLRKYIDSIVEHERPPSNP